MITEQLSISLNNPVVCNHKVYGQDLLPGLAYIDLIYQLFREYGFAHHELELRNVSIYNPLIVKQDDEVLLTIQCLEVEKDQWRIRIDGQAQQNGKGEQDKKQYITAELYKRPLVVFEETLDVSALKQVAKNTIALDTMYDQCRRQELLHTGLMKAEGQLYETEAGIVIDLAPGSAGLSQAEHFMFHPALIDGSGVGSGWLLTEVLNAEQKLYLPLFYEAFCASALLQTHCFTRIQRASVRLEKELIYLTLEFFDDAGHKVAELKNFASKLVRGAELIDPTRAATPTVAPKALPTTAPAPVEKRPAVAPAMDRASAYDEVEDFLRQLLAQRLNVPKEQIETDTGYYQMGLDSRRLLEVVQAIEIQIGVSLSPILLFEYTTIAELATFLAEHYAAAFFPAASSGQPPDQAPSRTSSVAGAPAIPAEARHEPSAGGFRPAEGDDIAIIGMAGRYPQAATIQAFWRNLTEGKDCISEIPASRWDWRQFEGITSPSGKNLSRWGGFIDDADCFDPQFFRISPREAESMDPQERLFLQTCWETIEDAGYTPNSLVAPEGRHQRHAVGVFVGVMHKDYTLLGADAVAQGHNVPLALNNAQIANRVSYHCNFHGPSMAIDTVCSSSLTAVHLALESIRRGECGVALAGGVNLSLHPHKYVTYGGWDMHSSDGYCHTFGQGGDGYVSAEGIGAVLLKPLRQAELDGDRIYAVIKGSAINHVGTVSGISVPSPIAQADVIEQCLTKTGIHPRTISYVEAHGTGTSLGDPIEIQGLVKAFQHSTQEQQFCAIGSVKSNIGHAESAAGISGLTKVALQLYHRTLVPSLHAKQLNPHLKLSQSPFYVQGVTEAWPQPALLEDGIEVRYPRRAGLSSFGASGSNAHLILEEYSPRARPAMTVGSAPVIVPLSARTTERLHIAVKNLAVALQDELSVVDLAYTLQVGREAMEERVVFVVNSIEELRARLVAFEVGQEDRVGCWRGHVKSGKKGSEAVRQDEEAQAAVRAWREKGDYTQLAQAWAHGTVIDWNELYGDSRPMRISVPTYPFARERYWIPDTSAGTGSATIGRVLHPLLHRNTSDFIEQRFSSTFTGQEFFLADHVIKEQKILPGVAYLEMALTAVEKAIGGQGEDQRVSKLKDVVWMRPIIQGNQPAEIHIRLYPEDNGEIVYEIYSGYSDKDTQLVYSQGRAESGSQRHTLTLDMRALREECNLNILTGNECYAAFETMGLHYGPGFQGIEKIYVGQDQLLAKISLPHAVQHTHSQYVLHPSLLDSAFHASIGLIIESRDDQSFDPMLSQRLSLPFALQELEILSPCPAEIWSYVRYSNDSKAENKIVKYDIDLCDETGRICVRMKGAAIRAADGEIQPDQMTKPVETGNRALAPVGHIQLLPSWEPISGAQEQNVTSVNERVVVLGGTEEQRRILQQRFPAASMLELQAEDTIESIAKKLQAYYPIEHILWLAPYQPADYLSYDGLITEQNHGVIQVFQIIKALLHSGYGNKDVSWSIITVQAQLVDKNDAIEPVHASLHGLAGTMAKEYTNWKIRLIDLEDGCNWPIDHMFTWPVSRQGHARAYRNGQWYQQQLVPFHHDAVNQSLYKTHGVYVVIGGAGYIGEVWSEYMMRSYQAQIIWIGRSQKNAAIQAKLDRLATLGFAPEYITADASNLHALEGAYKTIKERHGHIHGVINSAMVLAEQSLENMHVEEFKAGLSAKIDVSVRIAQVFQHEPLDFIIFFSSLVAYIKNVKQSHYIAGCAFEDAFAARLAKLWKCPVKVMNWGYWGNGEVANDENFVQLFDQIGLGLIHPQEGMKALEVLLAGPVNQMALINTTRPVAIENMQPGERIEVYPESRVFDVPNLQLQIPRKGFEAAYANHMQSIAMDTLLCKLLFAQLQTAGLFAEQTFTAASLIAKHKLHSLYTRWLEESLMVLSQHHYLQQEGEVYRVTNSAVLDLNTLWQAWEEQKAASRADSNLKAMVNLVDATIRVLPEILAGKVLATDIMFPDSSMELVEGIYKQNQVADYFNEVLADTVVAYVQERLKSEPNVALRILEIGAGTGGTSAAVFQELQPYQEYIQEYCYTDLSRAFLLHAEREYGSQNPYLTYHIFNVEAPIAGQNIDAGGYDIVIAANVLHATKNIRQTLRNTKAVLKSNGLLLLNEMAGKGMFTHLTFGLLEGWWLYEDPELRIAGCPGLYPKTWRKVLENEGFKRVIFPAQEAHSLSHQIVVAQSDGIIRQKQAVQPQPTLQEQSATPKRSNQRSVPRSPIKQSAHVTDDLLKEKSTAYIVKLVGETLKIPVNKIDSSDLLEIYGIDSIVVVQLTNSLRKVLDNVSSTLFFEHHTIDALVDHFIKTQKDALIKLVGLDNRGTNEERYSNDDVNEQTTGPAQLKLRRPGRYLRPDRAAMEPSSGGRDIAIIGLSGRYAQSNTVNDFWQNLKAAKNCITEIPADRWDWQEYYSVEKGKRGSIYTKWGGFIEDFDKFDPSFFQISPVEAERMDPQERVFLEAAYASIEDAGYTPATLSASRKIGVFAGVMNKNYQTGYGYWSIANRISYLLNFQGPSLAVDTACSSSLTAIHLALESLYSGSSECAIAGGVNLVVDPIHYLNLSTMNMLTPGDKCKSFGDQADGFVDGEGVGAIVLKPLNKAIEDGDQIYGVIKGSMVNAGGKTNGYTVPNPNAQFQLISEALQRANVSARTISYLEGHGTGTVLGDPIEIAGLTRAFEQDTPDRQFCAIGSVKSNIGHCESAAGMAGLTKILLQFKHRQLVPSLHAEVLNPNIDFKHTPFRLQRALAEWKRPMIDGQEIPRRAGISSFGAGGANAHLIVEEYMPATGVQHQVSPSQPVIIILSAKSEEQLRQQAINLLIAIKEQRYANADLVRIAYTLQVGREAMDERLGFIAASIKEIEEKLTLFVEAKDYVDGLNRGQVRAHKNALSVFTADEDMDKIIEAWASKRKYAKLLDLWVNGLIFDWNKLYGDHRPLRISLPTYPFARERYWLQAFDSTANRKVRVQVEGDASSVVGTVTHQPVSLMPEAFELMTFEETWREQPVQQTSANLMKTLVCFLSDPEAQKEIRNTIATFAEQTRIVFITQSTIDMKAFPDVYSLSRHNPDAYEKVLQSIQREHGEIGAILYFWALEDPDCVRDYASIVYILQAIAANRLKVSRLLLAGQLDQSLDRCYLESWIGFERSLGPVLPETKIAIVYQESDGLSRKASMEDWLQKCRVELQVQTNQVVLYRDTKRYINCMASTTLEADKNILRPKGTYLITGGCGGLGILFAKHLARQYAANLILTGRSPLTPEKQIQIEQLERFGNQVIYLQADVCDPIGMEAGLKQARARFGVIHGVIHAAGVESKQSIFEKDMSVFQEVIAANVTGTLILDTLLRKEPLDFICYFSSSSAILGDFGCCDYAIGNRFQMAYAHYRNKQQYPGTAFVINWPVWRDGGMAIGDHETTEMYLKSSGQRFLEAEEGINLFERILGQDLTQHLVLVGQRSRVQRFPGLQEAPARPAARPSGKGRQLEMDGLNTEQCLEWDLKEHINRLLKIPKNKLDLDRNWTDFGFDSINLAEFATMLTRHYGIEINPSLFFGYSTLEKLIHYFLADHQDAIEAFYREGVVESASCLNNADIPAEPQHREAASSAAELHEPVKQTSVVSRSVHSNHAEPIAIIGMSGRFPQADSVSELWDNLKNGKDCITEIPRERWDWREYYGDPHREVGKANSKWGAFLKDIDCFDPLFFQISPKEAETMDPRHRIFLEEAWHTFEDAGYMGERIKGKSCGVYVGVEEGEYAFLAKDSMQINGSQNATLSARIAYTLDLKGPNLALTAACSSGLVAIHQACQALRNDDCEMALVGGVSLNISSMSYAALSKADMLSPDGQCRVFDQSANGLVPGEAVAAVLLKPLSKAIADKDHIYGCIRASGVNYDGRTNGITAPNPFSQAELIESIYQKYDINPLDIQYVMAHSTGSKLGDPLEIQALTSVFKKYTDRKQFCTIGSIKPLIGHTFAASGVVGLISMLMAMKEQTIPATHHGEVNNAYINFEESPFILKKENQAWFAKPDVRRLGTVSSTGISGTNAHIVVEEYVPPMANASHSHQPPRPQIVVLSAKSQDRLHVVAQRMLDYAQSHNDLSLADVAYTLQVGREVMEARLAVVVRNQEQLVQALKEYLDTAHEGQRLKTSLPIFTGEQEEGYAPGGNLFFGAAGEAMLRALAQEQNFDKIAQYWAEGGKISWELLHEGTDVCSISLPVYPFAREHYWITETIEQPRGAVASSQQIEESQTHHHEAGTGSQESIQAYIVQFFSQELGLLPEQINLKKKYQEYGMDSILGRKLMRLVEETFHIKITGRDMLEHQTIQSLVTYLASKVNAFNQNEMERTTRVEKAPGKDMPYSDGQIIAMMEKFTQGELEFEGVQKILEGRK
ncbi:polyketide synthase PksM [Dictyobacter vulcani]|uniref:Polyketide synthase PksM n=1 Tax=Dictyobacter vulcani TaxID=2607529 RepID=A0A5J4KQ19_9CHLR|nr:SDR family NAD(P)-dependent oxidoreductase [Dictyobacter vulcani]GER89945.1 polyketide synthase PksM [Dictyobacter vulcani]